MMKRRGRVVAVVFILCAVGLVARLVQLQVFQHAHWSAVAAAVQEKTIEILPRRGAIADRNGELLAFDVKAMAIAIDSYNMTKPATLAAILSEELGVPEDELSDLVYRPSYFTWVDRSVELETSRRIERRAQEAGAYGLIFIDTWRRCYPEGRLASNVIGFVGTDGEGLEGIELAFDDELRGTPTRIRVLEGADGRTYHTQIVDEGKPGLDVALSIDARLQFVCEEEIERGVAEFRANAGMIIVLDPHTGDVLAMAQDKGYDLNRFWTSTAEERRNLAVTHLFEPGSIFKIFTGLAALEAGVVAVGDTFNGDDGVTVSGHVMHNSDNESFGTVTFGEIIKLSVNTGMIRVAQLLGEEPLHDLFAASGFGATTGIELPGEEKGILRPAERWTPLDLAASSIGQSIAVTGIQLARAMATLANGGHLIAPQIVHSAGRESAPFAAAGPYVSPATCATMLELMVQVVESGTGTRAAVDGFTVAGKTGTGQKATPGRGYVDEKYTSVFGGLLPAEAPEYVIVVVLDEVKTTPVWGGYTAGWIFHNAATRLAYLERLIPLATSD